MPKTTQKVALKTTRATTAARTARSKKSLEPAPKHRINPIKETITTIHGYPSRLVVYKIAASRFYWVRYYYNSRYYIKSTKCELLKDAKRFAVKFYEQTMLTAVSTQFKFESWQQCPCRLDTNFHPIGSCTSSLETAKGQKKAPDRRVWGF